MHKDGKWARQIIALQQEDGKWGWFHSLSQFYDAPITTEQALRRLEYLGFTIEDACIQRAVAYMDECLTGKKTIPDRAEKVSDWNVFSALILATWIRRFTPDNPHANQVAQQWAEVVSSAFVDGAYDRSAYLSAYKRILKPSGGRINGFMTFYPLSLLRGCLDARTENVLMDYALAYEGGVYYIYDRRLSAVPNSFESREASRYLAAIELLAGYHSARHKLDFAAEWLKQNRNANGRWDMGRTVNDKLYFPLSDNWRRQETREADCTERIEKLLQALRG